MIPLEYYLIVSAALFSLGLYGLVTRKNAINVLMAVELIFNSANINLVAFSRFSSGEASGQVFALFVIVMAAAEAAIAIAIFVNYYNNLATIDVDRGDQLQG